MSIPQLLFPPPGEEGFKTFSFWHANDHLELVAGMKKILGASMPVYILDPTNTADMAGFGLRHQAAHNDLNGLLQLQGSDLQSINLNDPVQMREWFYMNFQEHVAARQRLGI